MSSLIKRVYSPSKLRTQDVTGMSPQNNPATSDGKKRRQSGRRRGDSLGDVRSPLSPR